VLPVVVQPLITHKAIKKQPISFMMLPPRPPTSAANSSRDQPLWTPRWFESSMNVTLTPALRAQEPIIQNLAQLYTHDFSELWAGLPKGDLGPDGRFDPYPLDGYWTRPEWSAAFILSNGGLAGFVLINDQGHSDRPVDHNIAEFFVLRKHRRQGVGRRAAQSVFSQHPGWWEVAVARNNTRAGEFWRNTIGGAPQVENIHELDVANNLWNGPLFRFKSRAGQ